MSTDSATHLMGSARAWLSWFFASACLLFQFVVQLQPSVMIAPLEKAFAVDALQLGVLTSAYFVSYLALQVPAGWLLDRFGPRVVLALSMVLTVVGLLFFAWAESFGAATLARIGLGIAGAPAFPAAALVAARWFPPRRFALMLGLTEGFTLLGGVAADLVLADLARAFGIFGSTLTLAGCALVLGVFVVAFVHDAPTLVATDSQEHDTRKQGELFSVFTNPRIWLAAIHGGLFFGVVAAFGGLWAVPFLSVRLELNQTDATHLLSVLFLSGAIGAPILGVASAIPRARAWVLMAASVLCASAAFGVILSGGGAWVIAVWLVVLGFFAGAYAIDLAFVRDAVAPARRGLALGLANLIFGVIGGPILLMLISTALGEASGSGSSLAASHASLEQMRAALAWFLGALVLLVPIGVALLLVVRRDERSYH